MLCALHISAIITTGFFVIRAEKVLIFLRRPYMKRRKFTIISPEYTLHHDIHSSISECGQYFSFASERLSLTPFLCCPYPKILEYVIYPISSILSHRQFLIFLFYICSGCHGSPTACEIKCWITIGGLAWIIWIVF